MTDAQDPLAPLREHQDGHCAVCQERRATLVVDHDHRTGLVRGLLCRGCNTSEGRDFRAPWFTEYRANPPAAQIGLEVQYGQHTPHTMKTGPATAKEPVERCVGDEVIAAVRADPKGFMDACLDGEAWSAQYGGAVGVAQLSYVVTDQLISEHKKASALHAAAVAQSAHTSSLANVARLLGIAKSTAHKIKCAGVADTNPYSDRVGRDDAW